MTSRTTVTTKKASKKSETVVSWGPRCLGGGWFASAVRCRQSSFTVSRSRTSPLPDRPSVTSALLHSSSCNQPPQSQLYCNRQEKNIKVTKRKKEKEAPTSHETWTTIILSELRLTWILLNNHLIALVQCTPKSYTDSFRRLTAAASISLSDYCYDCYSTKSINISY